MIPALRADYPGGNRINEEPPVYLFENFLTAEDCAYLVELSQPHMQRAVVSGGDEGVQSDGRTGQVHWIAHDLTPDTARISRQFADLVELPLENAESIQVISYGPGQEYKAHYDAWVAGTETGDRCLARGGQRLVTCLAYLCDVEEGGGTFFPRLDMEVMPRCGRMVLFHNCHEGRTERHPASLHGGMPPRAGTKWACNVWFREGPYRIEREDQPTATTRRY
jgi:prolyl 4-hydroxylase